MPPRRGGRGRGSGRPRPPEAVRNAMAEIGMGSLTSYEMMAQAVARANADAARGYFPEVDKSKKAGAVILQESELNMTQAFQDFQTHMHKSPYYVRVGNQKAKSESANSEDAFGDFFYGKNVEEQEESCTDDQLWDFDKLWIIPELIPLELIPRKNRSIKQEKKTVKRAKVSEASGSLVGKLKDENLQLDDEDNVDGDDDGKKDGEEVQAEEPVVNDDEDDLELDADYQTGVRFDDDDGYEEQDSGAEEATF